MPQDKIPILLRKLEAYRDNDPTQPLAEGETRKRDNRKLAESISEIRRATLRTLWTDPPEDYPPPREPITWEVWLRGSGPTRAQPPEPDAADILVLRASVPRKVIGDLLGHRSEEATLSYLKLATEDLRTIALEIPG